MTHPLDRWFGAHLGRLFVAALALCLVTMVVIARADASLRCATAPVGIVSFELFARAGHGAAWAFTAAAIADSVENVPLVLMVRSGDAHAGGATLALVSATVKFALLGGGAVYLVTAATVVALRRAGRVA